MKSLTGKYRTIAIYLAATLTLLLCLSSQHASAREGSIGIFVVKSKSIDSYNQAVEGFRHGCSTDRSITEYDLDGSLENSGEMIKQMEKEKPDLVVAVGAKAMAALIQAKVSRPIVFCMVMNPGEYDSQAFNITGVSLAISPKEQIEVLTSLNPKIKKIAVLLRKQSSEDLLKSTTEMAKEYGIEIIPAEIESENQVPQKLRPILGKVDAIWMLDDAFINNQETLQFVILNSLENNLPFMAISKVFVKEGALVALSPAFYNNGEQAANMAEKILTEGLKPRNIPVSTHKKPDLIINLKIARKIGLTVPPTLADRAKQIYE